MTREQRDAIRARLTVCEVRNQSHGWEPARLETDCWELLEEVERLIAEKGGEDAEPE